MNYQMKLVLKIKHSFLLLLTAAFIFFAGSLYAVNVPALTGRVVDNANLLTPAAKAEITNRIINVEKNTGGQMAVLIIKSLNGESLENFGIHTAEKWKIGHSGKDNGLILIIVKNNKKIRIEVGYGWEGVINDARAGDIIRAMKPYFRNGDYKTGILKAVSYAGSYITGDKTNQPPQKTTDGDSGIGFWIFFILMFGGISFFKRRNGRTYRSGGGGFWGGFGGGSSGGGFSGGGGSFGGGGASGGW
ncbi:MAG: TPM domain-containing protein [bacterium]|nr:TPM domain-containing protein [bacterium]